MRYPTATINLPHEIRFLQIMSPPISGKSTLLPRAKNMLFKLFFDQGTYLILVENEVHGPGVRVRAAAAQLAEQAGISYDSPEFAKQFNFPGVLAYQEAALWAATDAMMTWNMPVLVLFPTPERDLDQSFKDMVEQQFAAMGASISFCTFYLGGNVEELTPVLKERKVLRVNQSPCPEAQRQLDMTKDAADYVHRRQKCINSANRFKIPSLELDLVSGINEQAQRLAEFIADATA